MFHIYLSYHFSTFSVPIQLLYIGFQNQSRAMSLFRKLAESSEFPTSVYADFFMVLRNRTLLNTDSNSPFLFQFAEQYNSLVPNTITSVLIAGLAVVLVSLLFIPEPLAAFWVSINIISINLGILGLMPFFSLHLDFISMVRLKFSFLNSIQNFSQVTIVMVGNLAPFPRYKP